MKYFHLTFLAFFLPFCAFSQVEPNACAHEAHANPTATVSQYFGAKNLLKSTIVGSDSCHDNGISTSLYGAGLPKTIPLVFHFAQDQAGERNFPDDNNTRMVMQAIVDRANEKLSDNQPMVYYNGSAVPPVNEIGFRFEYKDALFYQSTSWTGFDTGDPLNDPDALNIRCTEHPYRWIPQPEAFEVASTTQASCGNSDGNMVLSGLTDGRQYEVNFRLNGSSTITSWGNAVANVQGRITVTGLEAGSYTDISLRDVDGQDFRSVSTSIKNQGAPKLFLNASTNASSCSVNDGEIVLQSSNGANTTIRLLYEQDGVPQDVNVPMVNGFITLSNLPAAYYSHIRLVTSSGCISNSLNVSVNENNAPTIVADRIIPFSPTDPFFSQFRTRTNIEIGGLTPGNIYKAWIRRLSDGLYTAFDVLESGSGVFTVDGEAILGTGIGNDVYFEMYLTNDLDCARTNTLTFRPGDDFKPSGVGGSAGFGGTRLNMNEMYHRYIYRAGLGGVPNLPNPGHPYSGTETYTEYVNTMSKILIHEFGHIGSLNHTFMNGGTNQPCSDVYWTQLSCPSNSNNFMDNNCSSSEQNSFAPCQIEKMHNYLESIGWDRYYFCDNSNISSSLSYFPDLTSGDMIFANNFTGPSSGVNEIFTITPQTTPPSETYYAGTPILFLNLMRFAGQSIEVCANTENEDGCLGIEDCEIVSFPSYNACYVEQVKGINIITDKDGCPIELDPRSLSSKPHYWTFSAANGSSLSSTCVHNPDIIYSPEAEYLGDVLDVCVTVMGIRAGIPCTTEVCTTVVLPPKYTPCTGGPLQAPFFHKLSKTPGQNSVYEVDLRANSYTTSFVYEHIWIVHDNISGRESTVYGIDPALTHGAEFDREGRTIDLKVCHFIRNKLKDCIVGGECQDIYYDCSFSSSFFRIVDLTFDAANQELVLEYEITPSEVYHEVDIFLNKQLFTSYTNNTPQNTYVVTIPANNCGTAFVEINARFTLQTPGGGESALLCEYKSRTITYGPQPCIQAVATVVPSKGKRTGLQAQGYRLKVAPNPVSSGHCRLIVDTEQSETLELSLIDMQGKLVKRFSAEVVEGNNAIRVDVQGLAKGLYMLNVAGKRQQATKLLVE